LVAECSDMFIKIYCEISWRY